MNKIRQMLKQDLKNIFINEATFILIFLMLILPTLFVCFIITANRQPNKNLGQIAVALSNKDQGGIINGIEVNIGQEVTALIKDSDNISWQVVSYEEALRGTLIGHYYGQVIIPEDFTEKIATLNTTQVEFPKIQYDMNFQENIYAPTFNTINNASLQAEIERSIIKAVKNSIKQVIGDIELGSLDNEGYNTKQMIDAMLILNKNKELYLTHLEEYKKIASEMIVVLSNIDDGIANSKTSTLQLSRVKDEMEAFLANTIQLEQEYKDLTGEEIGIGYKKLVSTLEKTIKNLEYIEDVTPEFEINIKESRKIAAKFYSVINQISDIVVSLVRSSNAIDAKIAFLSQGEDVNKLIYNLKNNPELVAEYLEAPMLLERIDKTDVFNENITVAPFNMSIAMWIGKVILVTLLSVNFKNRLSKDEEENKNEIEKITLIKEYIAKGLFFIILGIVQDFLMISIVRLAFGVGKNHQALFLAIGLLGSVTFTVIVYTAVNVFKNLGKLGIYFISILQFFLLGGVFPLQLIPEMFFRINKVMPFIYVVGSFREIQVDVITVNLYKRASVLLLFTVYTVIFGILSKIYLIPYINKLGDVIQKSKLFIAPDK